MNLLLSAFFPRMAQLPWYFANMRALILEDNRDRRVAMIARLMERFPFLRVTFFDSATEMIRAMSALEWREVVVIALDHDLEMIGKADGSWSDPGTGLEVAQWLAARPQSACSVVVHTTNAHGGNAMVDVLTQAQWDVARVTPYDDLQWIDDAWFTAMRNAIVAYAPQPRRQTPLPPTESAGLLPTLTTDRPSTM
ncbi:MAG: hypothetical protein JNM18_07830 [Planctomycetaceae bacterium]|nr:hypothetical protein [Planctomycetaceae bacterium]